MKAGSGNIEPGAIFTDELVKCLVTLRAGGSIWGKITDEGSFIGMLTCVH